ncbi:MAG: HvfC family RiPP maturation protein [Gammaproteobacteria bacterium]
MDLAGQQIAFAAHLRDPAHAPAPVDVEPRRMAVYRELFFNNLVDLLGGTFPVLRRILAADGWRALVRDFYAHHHAHTPYFLELPHEFLDWLQARGAVAGEPPFLAELAHYEWVELALAISQEEAPPAARALPDPLAMPLAVSPLAWPLAYRWPVHRLGPEYRPDEPPAAATFLVVHRDAADKVQFLEVGADAARLLDALERTPGMTAREALAAGAVPPGDDAWRAAAETVRDLLARGVLCVAPGEQT